MIWGSTYLGIAIALESMPPLLMTGVRFSLAGLILTAWSYRKGGTLPTTADWKKTFMSGVLLFMGGNFAVVWAEQHIPSGIAAMIVTTTPFWFVAFDRTQWHKLMHDWRLGAGLLLGFGGVYLLMADSENLALDDTFMGTMGILAVVGGAIAWAAGTLIGKNHTTDMPIARKAGMQMLTGGTLLTLAGIIAGEAATLNLATVTVRSWVALLYLLTFGAIIGFICFAWLVSVRPPAQVGTYAYVNPVVAVLLGALVLNEPINGMTVIAMVAILIGVLLVNRAYLGGKKPPKGKHTPEKTTRNHVKKAA